MFHLTHRPHDINLIFSGQPFNAHGRWGRPHNMAPFVPYCTRKAMGAGGCLGLWCSWEQWDANIAAHVTVFKRRRDDRCHAAATAPPPHPSTCGPPRPFPLQQLWVQCATPARGTRAGAAQKRGSPITTLGP